MELACVTLDARLNPGVLVCPGGVVACFWQALTCFLFLCAASTCSLRPQTRGKTCRLRLPMLPLCLLVFWRIPMQSWALAIWLKSVYTEYLISRPRLELVVPETSTFL